MTTSAPAAPAVGAPVFPTFSEQDLQRPLRVARRLLGCDHLAQDALQEALLALSQESSLPDKPVHWLVRAVVLRSRHLRRTLRRRRHHEHIASRHCRLHGDCDNPLHVAMAHEIGERISATRSALPHEQRDALDLFERGFDYRQIAAELGVAVGTVRSRLARARRVLHGTVERFEA